MTVDVVTKAWSRWASETPHAIRWTRLMVDARMKEAMRIVQRVVQRAGPAGYYVGDFVAPDELDRWIESTLQEDLPLEDRDRVRVPVIFTATQMANMEEAIRWPGRYVVGSPLSDIVAFYNLWLNSIARRFSFSKAVRTKWGRKHLSLAQHRRRQGDLLIAIGLMRDKVPHGLSDEQLGDLGRAKDPLPKPAAVTLSGPVPDWWFEAEYAALTNGVDEADKIIAQRVIGEYEVLTEVGSARANAIKARQRIIELSGLVRSMTEGFR